jgi:hypothetical protein
MRSTMMRRCMAEEQSMLSIEQNYGRLLKYYLAFAAQLNQGRRSSSLKFGTELK